jgi:hypothetical protein
MNNFLTKQSDKLIVSLNSMLDYIRGIQFNIFRKVDMSMSTKEIIKNHKIKSRLLELLAHMNDLDEEINSIYKELTYSDEIYEDIIDKESYQDQLINRTISDLTPLMFVYLMNLQDQEKETEKKVESESSLNTNTDVD